VPLIVDFAPLRQRMIWRWPRNLRSDFVLGGKRLTLQPAGRQDRGFSPIVTGISRPGDGARRWRHGRGCQSRLHYGFTMRASRTTDCGSRGGILGFYIKRPAKILP
jgi:hypothetical protein